MYCSACGHALVPNQPVCPQCGRPVAAVPPVRGLGFELSSYVSRLRALAVVWYIFGGLSLAFGLIGLAFLDTWLHGRFGYWVHGPFPHLFGPAILRFAWVFTVTRAGLALVAGYGLMHREPWGRVVAIVAAFANILGSTLIGTALAIWTLITLMGYRNTTLYDSVAEV